MTIVSGRVSRAQRSTERSCAEWCAADPGSLRSVTITVRNGPGSAVHRSAKTLRAAPHPGHGAHRYALRCARDTITISAPLRAALRSGHAPSRCVDVAAGAQRLFLQQDD